MRLFPTSLHKGLEGENFTTCGYTTHTFWKNSVSKYGNVKVTNLENCDFVCLFTSYLNNYKFDTKTAQKISKLNKKIIIFDYSEYGGHSDENLKQYNIPGYKIEYDGLKSGDYKLLHEFIFENTNRIHCCFKRELSSKVDINVVPFKVLPLEFIGECYSDLNTKPVSKEEYYKRKCLYNFIWGYSNLSRPYLHGKMMTEMTKFNSIFALSFRQAEEHLKNGDYFMLLVNHDWYERVELMPMQHNSRAVIDLYGCGLKCFRNVESTLDCMSFKQDPTKMVFTYPWIDGDNCVFLPTRENSNILDENKSVEILLEYRGGKQCMLYQLYLNSIEMNKKYHPANYVPNHIIKNINAL